MPAGTEGSSRANCRSRKSGTVIRTGKNAGRVPIGIAAAKFVFFFWRRIYIFVPRVRWVQPDDTSVRIVGYLTAFDCLPSLAPWSNGHKVQAGESMPQGLYDRWLCWRSHTPKSHDHEVIVSTLPYNPFSRLLQCSQAQFTLATERGYHKGCTVG